MSYIGLLNESVSTTYTNVSAADDLTVGTSLRNLGTLTQIGAATFSGAINGLLAAVSNGTDLTYTYNATTKTFTIQINNGSITNSKLLYSSIVINGISISLGNSITLTTTDITEGTNLYYTSAKAQADAKLAISSTDSTEIDFTYLAGNITANLKDNSIDISRIKNTQIATANTANTLVLRDVYGNFSTGSITTAGITNNTMPIINNSTFTQIGAMKLGSAGTNLGSLYFYNATNTDYLQIATTANMSTISTNGTGVRQLALVAQSTNIYNALTSAPISVRDANLSSIYIALNATGINLTYGLNYQINGIEYLATKSTTNLIEGTNLYYSVARFLSQFALMNTGNLTEGTNLYYTDLRFDNRLTTKTTNDLIQGTTNKYYATSLFNLDLATKTTNDLIQGTTNKYYASSLFNSDLAAKTTNDLIQGTTNKYLNALTTTSPNEITLTLSANNLSGSLINNTIDITKLKSAQISTNATINTLVQRDATTGGFNAGQVQFMHGAWLGDYPSIILGQNNGVNQGVMKIFSTPSQYSLFEGNSTTGGLDLSAYQGTQLNINAYNSTGDCLITSKLSPNLGVNIPTGQTYKINNNEYLTTKTTDDLIQGTTNKYFNSFTTTATPTITHTFITPNLQSNINNLSITNGMLNGAITNAKLINSSITIGTTAMSLGSTYTSIGGGTPLNTYYTGITGITPTTATYSLNATPTLIIGNVLQVGKLVLQTYANNSYIDNYQSSVGGTILTPQINIGTIIPNQAITIGNNTTTLQLTASTLSPLSIKANGQGIDIPYNNVKFKEFIGSVFLSSVSPNWTRITNTGGTSTLEVKIYTSSSTGTFKIEGQIVNYYTSTNTAVIFNIASFYNTASASTQSSLVNMINGCTFVTRNIIGGNSAAFITPYITFCTFFGASPGDYFTFTAYAQSGTNFANGSAIGRSTTDIPTNMCVTQIA